MIPTKEYIARNSPCILFQSRNRETYDSNHRSHTDKVIFYQVSIS